MPDKNVIVDISPKPGNQELDLQISPAVIVPMTDRVNHPNDPGKWDKVKWKTRVKTGWAPRIKNVRLTVEPGDGFQFEGLDGNGAGVNVKTQTMKSDVTDGQTCKYDVTVKAELDGTDVEGHCDPVIVIDDATAPRRVSFSLQVDCGPGIDGLGGVSEEAIACGLLGTEHLIGIRVVEDGSELGFRAELDDPKQEGLVVRRGLRDRVIWCLVGPGTRGYGFYCRPKVGHTWPMTNSRNSPEIGCLPAGRARPKTELPAGGYEYDIVVARLVEPGGEFVIDPKIVIDDAIPGN